MYMMKNLEYAKTIRHALVALLMLIATATKAEEQTLEQIVADTLTFEEFAEWTAVRQKFQSKETQEKEAFLSCIESGTDKRLCTDPHFCFYPNHEKEDICYNSVTK